MTDITVIPALTVKGDINSDGAINGKDSNHLKQFISGSISASYLADIVDSL